jgi:hypothetical protein
MEALQTATLRVVAVIAEGVPEKDTKRMIAYARANNKVIIGPATVGGVQVRGVQALPSCKLVPLLQLLCWSLLSCKVVLLAAAPLLELAAPRCAWTCGECV